MKVLVTGGAGYIGSHAVRRLLGAGHEVTIIDNLDRGHRAALDARADFHQLDIRQTEAVTTVLQQRGIEAVMHFAALAYVGESVQQPLRYYDNNTNGSLSLLRACDAAGVRKLVFSSTCATYGEPERMPITEDMPQRPINPYGMSKLMFERVLLDYAASEKRFGCTILRYFNVAGCSADGALGEDHEPETHLIPVLLQAALGQRQEVTLFGDDYPTPDGTCVRDYIHVEDLVDAHIAAIDTLTPGSQRIFNLGIGRGYSVKEIVDSVERVTGKKLPVKVGPRRPGDPPQLYANASRIRQQLGWSAQHTDIDDIVGTAWNWFQRHPQGYADRKK